jgi:hypothetical protein
MWQAALLRYNFSEKRDLTIHFDSALTFEISNDSGQTVPTIVKARVPVHQAVSQTPSTTNQQCSTDIVMLNPFLHTQISFVISFHLYLCLSLLWAHLAGREFKVRRVLKGLHFCLHTPC